MPPSRPFLTDDELTIYNGAALEVLAGIETESVQCCVTSPPYWGLRDYGTGSWEGGDPGCDHASETAHQRQGKSSLRAGRANAEAQRNETIRVTCAKCGAGRVDHQLGLEPTPELYTAAMVEIFEQVRRVLRKDGTLWLNLGDSYNAYNGNRSSHGRLSGAHRGHPDLPPGYGRAVKRLKPKDLIGIPWRVAFALQEAGWYLRAEVIWSKPNPMPESVSDRPTKAHEQLFLLAKSGKPQFWTHRVLHRDLTERVYERPQADYWWFPPHGSIEAPSHTPVAGWERRNAWAGHDYFYDQDAVREPYQYDGRRQMMIAAQGEAGHENHSNRVGRERWPGLGKAHHAARATAGNPGADESEPMEVHPLGRNARSVWEIATQPLKDAHFAVFPPDLPRRCIAAGSAEGDLILDPFMGAGTTPLVARQMRRRGVGIELNPEYCELAARRLRDPEAITRAALTADSDSQLALI